MEIFFTDEKFKIAGTSFIGVPFFVDTNYKLIDEINDFFTRDLILNTLSTQTWKTYAYWLLDFFKWASANHVDWKRTTPKEILAYRNWSLEECNLKPSTVNGRITVLKRFFEYSVASQLINQNPIKSKKSIRVASADSNFLAHTHKIHFQKNDFTLKENTELPKFFSDDELIKIAFAIKTDRLALMMRIMLESGMRRSEVTKLPDEVILKSIKDANSLGPDREIPVVLPAHICKGRKSRKIFLGYSTVMKLMQYRNFVRPKLLKKYKLKNKKLPEGFWLTQFGTEYQPSTLSNEVKTLGKKIGIDTNPHKFRHTFATNYYAITKDLRSLQKLLGHSNIQTTTIYEHTAVEDKFSVLAEYHKHIDQIINS